MSLLLDPPEQDHRGCWTRSIDFAPRDVSVIDGEMSITRIHKTLAALGMVLCFALGSAAVSLAHDSSAMGFNHAFELRQLLRNGPVHLDAYTLTFGLDYEIGNVPSSAQPDLKSHPPFFSRRIESLKTSYPAQVQAPKVSFQILESVLII